VAAPIVLPVGAEKLLAGAESTFGTAATTSFVAHVAGSAKAKLSQTELEHNAASARLFKRFVSVLGLKSGDSGIAFGVYAKVASSQLNAAATPSTPYLGTLIKAILGGEYSAAGSTCAAGATTTSIPVQVGHGSRFRVGTVIMIQYSGALFARVVTAIATDTLTVWPALPGSPSSTNLVLNSYSYFLTEANSQSLTVEHTYTSPSSDAATVQRRLLGCTGGMSFEVGSDSLAQFGFDLKAADWSFGSLSVGTTVGSETMSDPIPVTNATVYLQPAATTTDTEYKVSKLSGSMKSGMTHLKRLGGVQGTQSVARMGGRDNAEFQLTFLEDVDRYADWSGRTLQRMLAIFQTGSGTSARSVSLYVNQAQIVGNPELVEEGGFVYRTARIVPVLDTSQTVDTAAGSPYVWSLC
jgi:hypothetical protein